VSIRREETANGLWIIYADGRIDQASIQELDRALDELLVGEPRDILIDLSGATYINSGGLRCLVSAWRRAQVQNSVFMLCGLNARLTEIITMVGFDHVFQIFDSCAEAREQRSGSAA